MFDDNNLKTVFAVDEKVIWYRKNTFTRDCGRHIFTVVSVEPSLGLSPVLHPQMLKVSAMGAVLPLQFSGVHFRKLHPDADTSDRPLGFFRPRDEVLVWENGEWHEVFVSECGSLDVFVSWVLKRGIVFGPMIIGNNTNSSWSIWPKV